MKLLEVFSDLNNSHYNKNIIETTLTNIFLLELRFRCSQFHLVTSILKNSTSSYIIKLKEIDMTLEE